MQNDTSIAPVIPRRALRDCLTFVIWQYDLRGEPLRPDMLQRQIDEILATGADAVLRGWFKWGSDLDYSAMRFVVDRLHDHGVAFVGGLTVSAIVRGENGISEELLADLTTCSAVGERREIFEGGQAYHVSIHNPRTADYMVACALKQVESGADGLHLDEIWGIGTAVSPHPNEGYDSYALAAFRSYLQKKYPHFTRQDWKSRFDIEDIATFDYRHYLAIHTTGGAAWATEPDRYGHENPLAIEWKFPGINAIDICDTWFEPDPQRSFYDAGVLAYGQRIIAGLRAGAARMGRPVTVSHNGPWPGVEFQNWNLPSRPAGSEVAELRCHRARWQQYRTWTDRWSGPGAAAVAFIDWPGDLPAFTRWPLARMQTFLATEPAECYAMGCSYAFHLRNWVPNSDARENGAYQDIVRLCRWFSAQRDLFQPRGETIAVQTNDSKVCAIAYRQPGRPCLGAALWRSRVIIHLINHRVQNDAPDPVRELIARVPDDLSADKLTILTPEDSDLPTPVPMAHGFRVPLLLGYAVVVAQ